MKFSRTALRNCGKSCLINLKKIPDNKFLKKKNKERYSHSTLKRHYMLIKLKNLEKLKKNKVFFFISSKLPKIHKNFKKNLNDVPQDNFLMDYFFNHFRSYHLRISCSSVLKKSIRVCVHK